MTKASISDIEWQSYGELDYGASHDLSAGFEEWSMLKNHLQQIGFAQMRTCVELGCGAGRLTNALAQDFTVVHALDVSPHRLTMASKVPNSQNVVFHLLEKPIIPLSDKTCDLCVSTHVLQHVSDMKVVENYLHEMYRVLRPEAFAVLHVPVIGAHGMTGNLTEVLLRRGKETVKRALLAITRQLMRSGVRRLPWKIDQYNVFSFVRLDGVLRQCGFTSVELRILPWDGGHSYVFARN
jgi:ubiquinone/menaquinone biosynthesis C-methylase UbiE